jgi:nucleoside 2-deoxyribosyltransferase
MMDSKKSVKVYLAGPTVFLPNAIPEGRRLLGVCRQFGFTGFYSLDPPTTDVSARGIFEHNARFLKDSDVMIAELSPFRGPHADDGTAFEVGMAFGLGIPIFAYTNDLRPLAERIQSAKDEHGVPRDSAGLEVENFGSPHNLMLSQSVISFHPNSDEAIAAAARYMDLRSTT